MRTRFACLVTAALLPLLAACSSGDEVASAVDDPSGDVTPATMRALVEARATIDRAMPALSMVELPGSSDPAVRACATGDSANGSLDLACLSGGDVTGDLGLTTKFVGDPLDQASIHKTVHLRSVCASGLCVAGTWTEDSTSSFHDGTFDRSTKVDVDVVENGATKHVSFGFARHDDGDTLGIPGLGKAVVFEADDASFAFDDASFAFPGRPLGDAMESHVVRGTNGSFHCDFSSAGGDCSGPASFKF